MERSRSCVGPFFGGQECQGPDHESTYCNPSSCPGIIPAYPNRVPCNVSCLEYTELRIRGKY